MPQTPTATQSFGKAPSGKTQPLNIDALGNQLVKGVPALTALNVSGAQVIKASPGWVGQVNLTSISTAQITAGGIYDCTTTAQCSSLNLMAVIPALTTAQVATLGVIPPVQVNMVAQNGICALTTSQIAISYE